MGATMQLTFNLGIVVIPFAKFQFGRRSAQPAALVSEFGIC